MNNSFSKHLAAIGIALLFFCFSSAFAGEWVVRFTIPAVDQSAQAVASLLQAVDGVSDVEVATADVTVSFDSDVTDTDAVRKKLIGAGFPVKKTNILQEG